MCRLFPILLLAALCAPCGSRPGAQTPAPAKPLDSPECVKVPEARGEQNGDEELCVSRNGEFCAYPLRMMAYHRLVNDHLGGVILVVYDPSSGVGQMYDRMVDGKELSFDPAEPVNGVPTVQDRETKSVWSTITGGALSGPLKGQRLGRVPSIIMTWGLWKRLHPDSYVLKEDVKLTPVYVERFTPATSPALATRNADVRFRMLKPDQLVVGVAAADSAKAYPLAALEKGQGVIKDTLGKEPVVVFSDPASRAAAAYSPEITGQRLRFTAQNRNGARIFLDTATSSVWTIEGAAVEGPLKGAHLTPVPFARCRWYAWAAAYPNTDVWRTRRAATPAPFSAGR
jgi:hypothetical protein